MTTTAFYPDAHPESVSVDGYTARSGVDEVWASIHGGVGNDSDDSGNLLAARLTASATTDQWGRLDRSILLFDTSSIGGGTVSSAILYLYLFTLVDHFGLSLDVVPSMPASDTAVGTGDYGNLGTTLLGTVSLASLTGGAYNAVTLNAAGIAAIATGGITKLGLRVSADRTNTPPAWGSAGNSSGILAYSVEQGGGFRPYLEVNVDVPAESGQGLVDLTPVAAAAAFGAEVLQQLLGVTAPAISAPIVAPVVPQPVEVTAVVPGVSRPWTSGEAVPLELTALAPTATFSAAAGTGLVDVSAPQIVALEAAGLSEVGRLDFTPVAATSTKAAASGLGLIDVTPLAAAASKAALHEWGRVWFAQPSADARITAASGQGLIDLTAAAVAGLHQVAAGVGLVDLVGVVMASAHGAEPVIGHWSLVISQLAAAKDAALPADVWLVTLSSLTASKGADLAAGSWLLAPVSPATTKSVTGLEVGLVDLTAVAATGAHTAEVGPVVVELALVSPNTTKAAGLDVGLIDLVHGEMDSDHGATAGVGAVELVGIAPETPKTAGDLAVASVELVGIAATRPYRKYAKTATLVRASTTSTLIRRGRRD